MQENPSPNSHSQIPAAENTRGSKFEKKPQLWPGGQSPAAEPRAGTGAVLALPSPTLVSLQPQTPAQAVATPLLLSVSTLPAAQQGRGTALPSREEFTKHFKMRNAHTEPGSLQDAAGLHSGLVLALHRALPGPGKELSNAWWVNYRTKKPLKLV